MALAANWDSQHYILPLPMAPHTGYKETAMNLSKRYPSATIMLMILALCSVVCCVDLALAQQGVPTRNVDEPGRHPFQQTVFSASNCGIASSLACEIPFSPVPPGKRLVVTYASADFARTANGTFPRVLVNSVIKFFVLDGLPR